MTQTDLFRLKWNNHNSNFSGVISNLFSEEKFCDVTLGAEGELVQAHRLVLIACSDYFQTLLSPVLPHQHPIFIMEGITMVDLRAILDYMYFGQVSVKQEQLQSVLKSSETLRVKSLGDISVQLRGMTKTVQKKQPEINDVVYPVGKANPQKKSINILVGPERKSKRQKLESDFSSNTHKVGETLSSQAIQSESINAANNLVVSRIQSDGSMPDPACSLGSGQSLGHTEEHLPSPPVKLDLSRTPGSMLSSLPLSPGKVSGPATGPAFRKKQSRVWSYFEKINNGQDVECTVCGDTQRYIGNTTNMTRHIERKHLVSQEERGGVATSTCKEQEDQEKKKFRDKRKSANRSVVWQYFSRDSAISPKKVKCKLCHESYAFCNNTTNLHLHLKTKHADVAENIKNVSVNIPGVYEQQEEAVEYEQQEAVEYESQEAVEYYLEASQAGQVSGGKLVNVQTGQLVETSSGHVAAGGQLVNVQTGQLVEASRLVTVEVCGDHREPVYVVEGDIDHHSYTT